MPRIGTIDERFQSYNVEMLEVTGGKFWRPHGPEFDALLKKARRTPNLSTSGMPAGMDPALYQYRPPIDLKSPRLRELAVALGPAYVRVSGTWTLCPGVVLSCS
jgi:heparanase